MASVAPEIGEAIAAAGLAVGAVSGGAVIATGIIVLGGIFLFAKVGEKISEVAETKSKRKQYHVCCCNKVGPSGKYMCHNFRFNSRKEAAEAARHFQNSNGVIEHTGHFHAARGEKKIAGYHFLYN